MTWFRLYSELLHDQKVQTLKPELFKAWINVLCLASANKRRGYLPSLKDIAFTLRITEKKADALIDELGIAGLIDGDDDGSFRIHNWSGRQHEGDTTSTARARRFRARRKAAIGVAPLPPREKYADYLASEEWQSRRGTALEAAGYRCSVCNAEGGENGPLDVHHRTYERLGHELDADIVVLCRACHGLFHDNGKLARPTD